MRKTLVIGLLALAPLSAPAMADPVDNYAAPAIIGGRYMNAVTRLEAQVRRAPGDESALLNLGIAYRHMGREADARAALARVLTLPDVELDTVNGIAIMAHDAARRALATNLRFTAR